VAFEDPSGFARAEIAKQPSPRSSGFWDRAADAAGLKVTELFADDLRENGDVYEAVAREKAVNAANAVANAYQQIKDVQQYNGERRAEDILWSLGGPLATIGRRGYSAWVLGNAVADDPARAAKSLVCTPNCWQLPVAIGEGILIGGLTSRALADMPPGEMVTIYRGINQKHHSFATQSQGLVRPNRRWWQALYSRDATPLEHNIGRGGTLNSSRTSWSFSEDVAINYALRPGEAGVVLRKTMLRSRLTESPNLKDVTLIHRGGPQVSEMEVQVGGVLRILPSDIRAVFVRTT